MAERRAVRQAAEALIARVARNVLPRTPEFGALLAEQTQVAVMTVEALVQYCDTSDPAWAARVSALEKDGDVLRMRNHRALRKAFSTGFDRDLTATAIRRIDDIANYAKTTVREMQTLDLEPDEHTRSITRELLAGTRELHSAALALGGDPKVVERHVRAVRKHERNVEKRYREAIRALFPRDPGQVIDGHAGSEWHQVAAHLFGAMRRREVYRHLSNAADRLDGAGHILEKMAVSTV